jgi:hypothetical protein
MSLFGSRGASHHQAFAVDDRLGFIARSTSILARFR